MSTWAEHKRSLIRRAVLCLVGMAPLGACALFGGGGEGTLVRSEEYSVSAPADWKPRDKENSDYAYRLPSGNIATVTSSCRGYADAPLPLLTKHLLFGMRNVLVESREPITVAGNEGLLSKVRATMDGAKFQLMLVVTRREACVFDFTLMSPKDIPPKDESEFIAFVKTFKYGKH